MEELGKVLKSRREELGLHINDMEEKTKIRKKYLEALEEGDWSPLPGIVYARGFVRSYAEHLGLDGRALLQQYVDKDSDSDGRENRNPTHESTGAEISSKDRSAAKPSKVNPTNQKVQSQRQKATAAPFASSQFTSGTSRRRHGGAGRSSRNWFGQTVAVVGVLAVLGAGLWWITGKEHSPKPYTSTTGDESAAGKGGTTTAKSQGTGTSGQTPPSGSTGRTTKPIHHHKAPATTPKPVQVVAQPLQGNNLTYMVRTHDPLHVLLTARTRLWTEVTADGTVVDGAGGETLTAGVSKPYTAQKSLKFVIGNVPGASFVVNGQPLTLPGVNQVLNITFIKTTG